jgi:hypothetical protein
MADDIMDCAHNDTIFLTNKAPTWTPIHFNSDEQMRRKLRALIDGSANHTTNTSNRTNNTTNSNNKSNGNNTNNANQQVAGPANKKQRLELTQNQRKGTVIMKDPAYNVLGPAKGQCKAFHTYGEECPDGNACKHNHDHIRVPGVSRRSRPMSSTY